MDVLANAGEGEKSPIYSLHYTVQELYPFRWMPFGLTNDPASWQDLIDTVLGADLGGPVGVMVYSVVQ